MLFLLACAYEPPLGLSEDYPAATSLSGELVLASGVPDTETRVGHVLLYDVEDLPPPQGFGGPVDLSTVASSAWSYATGYDGTGLKNGTASAEWELTGVPDGTWILTALVDNDGDFSPFPGISGFAGGATCGDQTGAYVFDAASSSPVPITTTAPSYQDGLDLLVGPPIAFERPAFELWTPDTAENHFAPLAQSNLISIDPTIGPLEELQVINLVSHPVAHPLLTLNPTASSSCPTAFTVVRLDTDGDGEVDPHPSELAFFGYEQVYPQVLMVLIADAGGNKPVGTFVSPLPVLPYYNTNQPPNTPFTTTNVKVLFTGTVYESVGGELIELTDPAPMEGTWSLLVLNENGQTWQVPNGLSDAETWPEFAHWVDPTQGAVVVTVVGG